MYVDSESVSLTTSAGGAATGFTKPIRGRILALVYTKTDFDNGVDFTITGEDTGQTIWTELNVNASVTVNPRVALESTAGVALVYAAAGEPLADYVFLPNERVSIVIAAGGNVKTGAIRVIYDGISAQ